VTKEEQDVIYAAIRWYREVMRDRDQLSPYETKLFYAVNRLEDTKVIQLPASELYPEDRSTTPAPSILIDKLVERSKKGSDGD